ncbi:MAG: hypothetical protein KDB21_19705 [Acidimicrobiales bacterium]|nr:hypothetical protein [Acidimicrobiales bacterium]
MRFAVETWDPGYQAGPEVEVLDPTAEPVDVSVEIPADQWAPVAVPTQPELPPAAFVDGVRRVDARAWVHSADGTSVSPALCASVAAGVVRSEPGRAALRGVAVRRGVVARVPDLEPIPTRHGIYEAVPVPDDDDAALYLGIHQLMTGVEVEVSELAVSDADVAVVLVDGPLRGRGAAPPDDERAIPVVGYIKTHHRSYVPLPQEAVVAALSPGQRSPVFLVGGRFTRFSWYVRLPGPQTHPQAGVVRCELAGHGGVADAVAVADLVAALLPPHASTPYKEARAPQNLHVIAGLERALRHRLGDARLLERALREQAALVSLG